MRASHTQPLTIPHEAKATIARFEKAAVGGAVAEKIVFHPNRCDVQEPPESEWNLVTLHPMTVALRGTASRQIGA